MSGGSLDYVGGKMREGDVNAFMYHVADMIADLERTLAEVEADKYQDEYETHHWRKEGGLRVGTETYAEWKAHALIAIPSVITRMKKIVQVVSDARLSIHDLHKIGTTIDRRLSGDDGGADVVDDCVSWLHQVLA